MCDPAKATRIALSARRSCHKNSLLSYEFLTKSAQKIARNSGAFVLCDQEILQNFWQISRPELPAKSQDEITDELMQGVQGQNFQEASCRANLSCKEYQTARTHFQRSLS